MNYIIRELKTSEYPILNDFLYEAIFVPEGVEPPPRSIVNEPNLQVYVRDFGTHKHDRALIAETNDKIVGAVWVRIMNDYGHIDDCTPSFAISLYKEYRGMGIGSELMRKMLGLLKNSGYKQASLAVQKANYAVKMYRKLGFEIVGENDEEYIMVHRLNNKKIFKEDIIMSNEMQLKYGCNPNQKPSRVYMEDGSELPIEVLCGRPGYINLLDALNGWQLVKELKAATGMCAATSFKHVSPAGAAIGRPLSDDLKKIYWVDDLGELTPLASAYARARGADRMSSYGDFIALSDTVDVCTAKMIQREVSDGIIAPGYEPEALEILKSKRKGTYCILKVDESYKPAPIETKQVYGVSFEQGRNELDINRELLANIVTENKDIPDDKKDDLLISLITLKYTQSNSVCYVKDGQAIGIGAGQQSRIHCTRLAGQKADNWWLRQSPKVMGLQFVDDIRRADRDNAIDVYIGDEYEDVLRDGEWQRIFKVKPEIFTAEEKKAWLAQNTGVCLGSDAFFPFGDNIERAKKSGVEYIAEPGGSIRDDNVIDTCNKYGIAMAFTGIRLFHH